LSQLKLLPDRCIYFLSLVDSTMTPMYYCMVAIMYLI